MGLISDIVSPFPNQFALEIAGKIIRQFPPSSEPQLVKKGAQRRLEGVLSLVMKDLESFQAEHKLGWVGKARFGNSFRWALTEKGYSKEFVEALTEGVILNISKR